MYLLSQLKQKQILYELKLCLGDKSQYFKK